MMIELDGGIYSGSGTLLRYAVSLATLTATPLHMVRIREKRSKPGLRPQHLQAVQACCTLCGGELDGGQVGSREISYRPGERIRSGDFRWDIGTAGSTTMLAMTVLPLALYAREPTTHLISGGLFQDFAPSAFFLQQILLPLIGRSGADVQAEILRPGYVPRGQGKLKITIKPLNAPMDPIRLVEPGKATEVQGISLSSHLEEAKVSERMAEQCRNLLEKQGYTTRISVRHDKEAVQKGAALMLWAKTDSGSLLGADRAGKIGRSAEAVARHAVHCLLEDLHSGATVDRFAADQLILFAALARGSTRYRIPRITDHVQSNLWLVKTILGVEAKVDKRWVALEGMGLMRHR